MEGFVKDALVEGEMRPEEIVARVVRETRGGLVERKGEETGWERGEGRGEEERRAMEADGGVLEEALKALRVELEGMCEVVEEDDWEY